MSFFEDLKDRINDNLKYESRFKIIVAGAIVLGVLFLFLYNPYDEEYFEEVEKEIVLAKKICENSRNFILSHQKRLTLDNNVLRDIKVNGKKVELEHVKYPKVLFFHTGYGHKGAHNELYCSFSDPRKSSMTYYFEYERSMWVPRTRTRR